MYMIGVYCTFTSENIMRKKSCIKKVVVPKRANYTIKQTELVTITQGLTTFTQSNCNVAACDGIMVK